MTTIFILIVAIMIIVIIDHSNIIINLSFSLFVHKITQLFILQDHSVSPTVPVLILQIQMIFGGVILGLSLVTCVTFLKTLILTFEEMIIVMVPYRFQLGIVAAACNQIGKNNCTLSVYYVRFSFIYVLWKKKIYDICLVHFFN